MAASANTETENTVCTIKKNITVKNVVVLEFVSTKDSNLNVKSVEVLFFVGMVNIKNIVKNVVVDAIFVYMGKIDDAAINVMEFYIRL